MNTATLAASPPAPSALAERLRSLGMAVTPALAALLITVVLFSVVVQGGLVPWVAGRLRLPVSIVEQEPWGLGIRFHDEPQGLHRFTVVAGAAADGAALEALTLGENVWVSFVGRDGALVQVRGETVLRAGDEVLVLAEPQDAGRAERLFTRPAAV
jgi:cell volume regulation protein A